MRSIGNGWRRRNVYAFIAWAALGALGPIVVAAAMFAGLLPITLAYASVFVGVPVYWGVATFVAVRWARQVKRLEARSESVLPLASAALTFYAVSAPIGGALGFIWVLATGPLTQFWLALGIPLSWAALMVAGGALTSALGKLRPTSPVAISRTLLGLQLLFLALLVTYGPVASYLGTVVWHRRFAGDVAFTLNHTLAVLSLGAVIALVSAFRLHPATARRRVLVILAPLVVGAIALAFTHGEMGMESILTFLVPLGLLLVASFEWGYWRGIQRQASGKEAPDPQIEGGASAAE